ncbi:MAG: HNH endonuclease [Bacilli bacterium]
MILSIEEKQKNKEERNKIKFEKEHKLIDGILHKWCNVDNHWVVMDDNHFYKNKTNTIDGYSTRCKKCEVKKAIEWQKNNREKWLEHNKKMNSKPSKQEAKRENTRQKRERGFFKEYFKNNPDKAREYNKNRQQKNHKISKKEWELCLKYFNNQCAYCGMTLEEHKEKFNQQLHKEHVIHNGANDLSNCVPSCRNCNSYKWEHDFEEWYKKQTFFTQEKYNKIIKWLTEDYKKYIKLREDNISINA